MASRRQHDEAPPQPAARTGRPPDQLGEVTRKRILAGARDCFMQWGFERATNKQIALSAGITAAALYRHFASKAEIYAAVVDASSVDQAARMRRLIESEPTVKGAFVAILRSLADGTESAPARFLSDVPAEMQRHPEIARHMIANPGELDAMLRELVAAGVATGELEHVKAEAALTFLIASMIGISSYVHAVGRAQGEHAVAGLLHVLDGQLFRTPSSRTA
ncbi:MAG: TetR/AcrR family transcriptional regulator [Polyangiales bacterium]